MNHNKNNKLFDVREKIIIITGGSGNLGSIYAEHLVNEGALVYNLDIKDPKKNKTSSAKNYNFLQADLTKRNAIKIALEEVVKTSGIPDALINNAALDSPPGDQAIINGRFEDYPEDAWDDVIEVNLKSIFLCCQVIGASMSKNNNGGSIVNISSHYGIVSPDQRIYSYRKQEFNKPISYATSKSGVLNLTRYLSTYWGSKNIRVNTLTLGGVFDGQDEQFVNNYSSKVPLGRMATKEEYCGAIQFLISSASSYMTGANLILDGGWTAW
ncbi:MAG: short-chain dehydrogenase [Dehalococcoidia bacterium]|nr:short-chain dehydrogenase [Dehalococcoidia bacterium]